MRAHIGSAEVLFVIGILSATTGMYLIFDIGPMLLALGLFCIGLALLSLRGPE